MVSDLFALHHRRLVGLASLLMDDRRAAEDVVQEAFAGLYRLWQQYSAEYAAATTGEGIG